MQITFLIDQLAADEDAAEHTDAGFIWRQLDRGSKYDVTGMCVEFVRM